MDTPSLSNDRLAAPAVSVVIPVYNLEGYLAPCIESVRRQSYPDFEAIVVDDGSKDGSLAEIRRLTAGDDRFVVLSTENRGVARARETALSRSRGRYVCFLDGDDWWEPDMLERMVAAIEERADCDIVCGNYTRVCASYRTVVREERTADLEGLGYLREVMTFGVAPSLWGKLFRRSLFDGTLLHYPMRRGQDTLVKSRLPAARRTCASSTTPGTTTCSAPVRRFTAASASTTAAATPRWLTTSSAATPCGLPTAAPTSTGWSTSSGGTSATSTAAAAPGGAATPTYAGCATRRGGCTAF